MPTDAMSPADAQIEAAYEAPSRKVQALCHGHVRRAIAAGRLVRPNSCQRCGKSPPPNKAGISQIHAHHHDHSKPLDVEWLCVGCHRLATPKPTKPSGKVFFGTSNGQARLDADKVRIIRSWAGKISTRQIGDLVGVHRTTVQRVLRGEHWTHVR